MSEMRTGQVSNDQWLTRLGGEPSERDAALAELRELLVRGLTRSLGQRYGGGIQIEDVVQESLLKIMKSLDKFEGRSRFTTWAMTIATRVGISALRRKRTQDISLDALTAADSLKIDIAIDHRAEADQSMDKESILRKLQELIDSELTDRQRMAVQGLLNGLPVEVIARRTDSNRNAIYKLVHDARLKLKDGFEQSGIMADEINAIFA